jgi:uncharacterized protein
MKQIPLLLLFVLLVSCAKEIPADKLLTRQGLSYEVNSDKPYTGLVVTFHENEQLKTKSNYKEGKKEGVFEQYYNNGQLRQRVSFVGGEPTEPWQYYDESGQLTEGILFEKLRMEEGEIATVYEKESGELFTGPFISFHENNKVEKRGTLIDGKLHGVSQLFYNNGQLSYGNTYKFGLREGLEENFYENGQLFSKTHFVGGKQVNGVEETFRENGELMKRVNWKNGLKDGLYETYHDNGELHEKGTFVQNFLDGKSEEYDESGKLKRVLFHKEKSGESFLGIYDFEEFNENGQLVTKGSKNLFRETGVWEFYENEQLKTKRTHLDSERGGRVFSAYLEESYYENGNLKEKGKKINFHWEGTWEEYRENGIIKEKDDWRDGKIYESHFYNEVGDLTHTYYWIDGEIHRTKYYNN